MQLPPDELPENLSADEYQRLSTLYSLMGRSDQAIEAMNRAQKLNGELEALQDDAEYQYGVELGQKLGLSVLKMLRAAADGTDNNDDDDPNSPSIHDEIDSGLDEMMVELESLGISKEEVENLASSLKETIDLMRGPMDAPPRDVPEGLSAQEYYELGIRYKGVGWTEQARDALMMAIEMDPDGEDGKLARVYLRSKIPRHPIPLLAEQTNVQGFNEMMAGNLEGAKEIFEELIREYPDFEWPYGNLGAILIQQGRLDKAKRILDRALEINPSYVNGWLHLCRANILDSEFDQARHCISEVLNIDPHEQSVPGLLQMIDTVENW